jgi:hypothetical protein
MLIGYPTQTLSRMRDPATGVAAVNKDFSLAAAKKWLDDNGAKPPPLTFRPQEPDPEPITPEEVARRDAMVRKNAELLRQTTERMRTEGKITGKRMRPPPKQVHHGAQLIEALESLEDLKL